MKNFIWLPKNHYPEYQKTYYTIFADKSNYRFCVAEFKQSYKFDKAVKNIHISVTGDTKFRLWLNDKWVGTGPVAAGGDYGNVLPMPKYYYNEYDVDIDLDNINFFAQVYLSPDVMTDYSCGRGGFILRGDVTFTDGSTEVVRTDESWLTRLNASYKSTNDFDATVEACCWHNAQIIENVWKLANAPIPMLQEEYILPQNVSDFTIDAGQTRDIDIIFDKIYSGYVTFNIDTNNLCEIKVDTYEVSNHFAGQERIITDKPICYRGMRMQSIGGYRITVTNKGDMGVKLSNIGQIFTCYPVTDEGNFTCSDEMLNKIYEVGKHTLKICRQTLHLDSPMHQETLGCTGDYFIESLISYFTFGDPLLTRLDIIRTADWLCQSKGFMFHTSYSLIWVQMLYDYYMFTADEKIFNDTSEALDILLERFHKYLGENGVIENAPNYMFIDWVPIDGFNMHHPPKSLGQTALNAFYYKALTITVKICEILGENLALRKYSERAKSLKIAFESFYDTEKGLYFDGFNTQYKPNEWLPANTDKRYYSKHSNTLAVLYGLAQGERAVEIMEKVINDNSLIDVQPYFMHYIIEALTQTDLFEKYGMSQIHRFDSQVNECDKGMKEGWGEFHGDYSHAWGATATYQLPCKLLGFKMIEPGFRKISLSPKLIGLSSADISIPTPYGNITCKMEAGRAPITRVPTEIDVE